MKHMQYKPNFPSNFPSTGVWEITYFDEYKEGHPLCTHKVFIAEHMGQFKLLRQKTRHGWDYAIGEDTKYLMPSEWEEGSEPYYSGQWRMYTWQSIIHLVSARCIKDK